MLAVQHNRVVYPSLALTPVIWIWRICQLPALFWDVAMPQSWFKVHMVHMVHNFVLCSTFLHPCANQLQCWLLDPFWPLHGFLATHYICLGDRSGWHCNFGTLYSTSIIVHSARCARAALWTISAHPRVACKLAPCCHHWVLDAKLRRGKKLGSILFQSVGAWEKMRKPGIYSLQATLGVLSLEDARSYCTWCCSWQSISSTWCCALSLSLCGITH